MTEQTLRMAASLPKFKSILEAVDGRGSARWRIVRWKEAKPSQVSPAEVAEMEYTLPDDIATRRYSSRTEALRASAQIARESGQEATENSHWGVWRLREGETVTFQTALPENYLELTQGAVSRPTRSSNLTSGGSMVRLSDEAYTILKRIVEREQGTQQGVVEAALRAYDRISFFRQAEADLRRLKADPEAWEDYLQEQRELEGTLMDNQDPSEIWDEERRVA